MSAILKALKRLETEPSNSEQLLSMSKQARSRWYAGRTRKRVKIMLILILVLLLFVSIGGIFWYRIRIPIISELFDSTSGNHEVVGKITSAKSGSPINAGRTNALIKPEEAKKPPPAPISRRPKVTSQARSSQPAKTPIAAIRKPSVTAGRRPPVAIRPPKGTSPTGPGPAKSTLPTLADSNYTLQAIAWSENPGERLTVINGQVLREGDGIQGITVIQIGTNEVIVEKESKRWKMAFQAR